MSRLAFLLITMSAISPGYVWYLHHITSLQRHHHRVDERTIILVPADATPHAD
jgi:hypothetical protein